MKKYLFGLFAIALAIGFSAFTMSAKKLTTADFIFDETLGSRTVLSDIQDPLNYKEATTESCTGGDEVACRINGVDQNYWHTSNGVKLLNASSADFDSGTDAVMSITAGTFHINGTTDTYYVSTASSFSGLDNKQR
jgi:hypothetical protein